MIARIKVNKLVAYFCIQIPYDAPTDENPLMHTRHVFSNNKECYTKEDLVLFLADCLDSVNNLNLED